MEEERKGNGRERGKIRRQRVGRKGGRKRGKANDGGRRRGRSVLR